MKYVFAIYLMGTYGDPDFLEYVAASEEIAKEYIRQKKAEYPALDFTYEPITFISEMPK